MDEEIVLEISSVLSEQEVKFVRAQRVAHLATVDASAQPHAIPVCFAYDGGRFYIAIDAKPKRTTRLKRLRNIEENARVALVFDRYGEDWSRLGWVLLQGTAGAIEGGSEHERALAALRAKYVQYRSMALEGRPVIVVTPERVSSWGRLDD